MTMTSSSSQYFDKVAGQWDTIRSGYFTEAVREMAIAKAYLRPEMVVADVGAGTGFVAAGLAPLVQKVYVLDGAASMLDMARQNLSSFGDKIEYHVADGQALPLPDASVDAAFANMYLHHCSDPLLAIREMVRILKPGGRLVITDMDSHPYEWLKTELADEWAGFERSQVRTWFKEADLVNIIVDCTGQSCCAETQNLAIADEQGRTANISIFVATATKRISMKEAVKEAYTTTAVYSSSCSCNTPREKSQGSCCSTPETTTNSSCCSSQFLESAQDIQFISGYSLEEKAAVPPEVEAFSLGCGNPIAIANLRPGDVVLDIGSGGGMDSFLAASKVRPDGKVIGVDMTPAMLERATQSAQKAGIKNVEFRQGQAEALPVEEGSIDVVLSNCVVNLCEDKGLVFQEAYRVLKADGRLELSDIVTSGPFPLDARQKAEEWAGCISGALPETEYLDLISQAGFILISSRRSTSAGEMDGVSAYSVIVSARKGSSFASLSQNRSCTCS
jgi:arsenite methyltransferase